MYKLEVEELRVSWHVECKKGSGAIGRPTSHSRFQLLSHRPAYVLYITMCVQSKSGQTYYIQDVLPKSAWSTQFPIKGSHKNSIYTIIIIIIIKWNPGCTFNWNKTWKTALEAHLRLWCVLSGVHIFIYVHIFPYTIDAFCQIHVLEYCIYLYTRATRVTMRNDTRLAGD